MEKGEKGKAERRNEWTLKKEKKKKRTRGGRKQ